MTLSIPTGVVADHAYTATVKGGATDPRVRTPPATRWAADYSWSFTTAAPPPPPPTQGPGGPVLVVDRGVESVHDAIYAEILRTEGLNAFATADIATVTPDRARRYDVVILGEMPLTAAQVTMFTDWVTTAAAT